ncbi:cyclic beta-1,2-glucan ABC transporter [Mycobacteroides abscessus subsp. abscessus]|nr:cyclic beta-1,2-glucan ABC transporter [Mycobacteroides abscessus subsp. abscessus]
MAIARAFLKRAPIVLIDEAASALDPENEPVAELRSGTGVFATLQRRFAQAAAWRLTPADA